MNNRNVSNVYFKQLNGIRFIAVMLVLIDHWFVESLPLPLGHLGVVIFFVLSGFLITRILFTNADDCRINNASYWLKIKNFIVRRSLRIFPIYFIICIIGLFFSISPIRQNWIWMFTYTPNWYIIFHKQWIGVWDHFWSLAVEEQYYLIFPYFILFLNPKKYKWLLIIMILAGICTRLYFFLNFNESDREKLWFISYVNPFSAIDCFGLGGLLAYFYHYSKGKLLENNYNFLLITFASSFVILLLNQTFEYKHASVLFLVIERSVFALFSYFLIANAIQGNLNLLGKFLENKVVSYLGKISYGLYLYHNFIYNYFHNKGNTLFGLFDNMFNISNYIIFNNLFFLFLVNFVLLIAISSVSWFCIESPINSLKKYFE